MTKPIPSSQRLAIFKKRLTKPSSPSFTRLRKKENPRRVRLLRKPQSSRSRLRVRWLSMLSGLGCNHASAFTHGVEMVGGEIGESLHLSVGPDDFSFVELFMTAQSKMSAKVLL